MQTEIYSKCLLEISEKEMKYNDGSKYKQINTFHCDPSEPIIHE